MRWIHILVEISQSRSCPWRPFPVQHIEEGGCTFVLSFQGDPLAPGARDGAIKIWNVATGEVVQTLKGHTDYVRSVEWSPKGDQTEFNRNVAVVMAFHPRLGENSHLGILLKDLERDVVREIVEDSARERLAYGVLRTVRIWDVSSGS